MEQSIKNEVAEKTIKPLLRGWSHALAALASIILTVILCWLSRGDLPRLISLLIFGLSMIELYTISALYHIVTWNAVRRQTLRALDHANIFVLIAGTYTPLCFNILTGWVRVSILIVIWLLAILGVSMSVLTLKFPRWTSTALYIGMGWIVVLALPAFLSVLPWVAVATLVLGGVLYTIGAVVYARKRPNPFPRVWGYHEIFHFFVITGSAAFAACIWIWALPFPRH
ncbi:MAG TPA: hemolysin III family protein [Ktedonobacteraceae bacterium]|jgi:hemolysin III|nr:hemolysin III family protein [Ktedonobacteraceae bacterium]